MLRRCECLRPPARNSNQRKVSGRIEDQSTLIDKRTVGCQVNDTTGPLLEMSVLESVAMVPQRVVHVWCGSVTLFTEIEICDDQIYMVD